MEARKDPDWTISAVTDVRWFDARHDAIRCTVTFPNHFMGLTQPVSYVAVADDVMPHGAQLFKDLIAGKYGPIAEYSMEAPEARSKRTPLLQQADLAINRAQDTGDTAGEQAWRKYRHALRDISKQPGFPANIVWPVQPV